jgi:hypothetical protein
MKIPPRPKAQIGDTLTLNFNLILDPIEINTQEYADLVTQLLEEKINSKESELYIGIKFMVNTLVMGGEAIKDDGNFDKILRKIYLLLKPIYE